MTPAELALAGVGSALTGTVGPVVYSRNRHGPYSYVKPPRANPNTARQQVVRGNLAIAVLYWQSIPVAWRQGWKTLAENVLCRDPVGYMRRLTGRSLFLAATLFRGIHGTMYPPSPPTILTKADLTEPGYRPFIGMYIFVDFALPDGWRTENLGAFVLFSSPPQTANVHHFTGPWRHMGSANGSPTTPPTTVLWRPAWAPVYGKRYIWVKARCIRADNRLSPSIITRVHIP